MTSYPNPNLPLLLTFHSSGNLLHIVYTKITIVIEPSYPYLIDIENRIFSTC
jgi:hypothetical protein